MDKGDLNQYWTLSDSPTRVGSAGQPIDLSLKSIQIYCETVHDMSGLWDILLKMPDLEELYIVDPKLSFTERLKRALKFKAS